VNATTRLLLALPALLLAACLVWLFARGQHARPVNLPAVEDGASWPRAIHLPEGLDLVLDGPPARVLLGNASSADMITALVGPERLAALPEQAFKYSVLADQPGAFAGVHTFARFEAEVVLSFDPDLVVVDPWAAIETVARLRELGVKVLSLPAVVALDDVRESLRILGLALGAEEKASALLADLDARVAALRASAPRRAGLRALSYANSGAGGWSAGLGTTNHELITLAGLENATAQAGRRDHVRMSFEDLYALDPDFLLVGDYHAGEDEGSTARLLQAEPALADLRAVREHRILLIPARLFSASSQEIVRGAELLAQAVDAWLAAHPSATADAEGR
jgi:iron complex transport system substrate-binding protein